MRKKIMLFCLLSVLLFGCKYNVSLFLKPQNQLIGEQYMFKDKNEIESHCLKNNYYELSWGYVFPIRYFDYEYKTTTVFLHQFGEDNIDIRINEIKLEIDSLNYSQSFQENTDMFVSKKDNVFSIKLNNCMSDLINKDEDILKLRNVTSIKVTLFIENDKEIKAMSYNFIPIIDKSNRILDGIMSV